VTTANSDTANGTLGGESTFTVAPSGFRLPADLHLGPIRLQIANLDRSLSYYQRVLGLHILDRTTTTATLSAQGDPVPLVELRELAGANRVPRGGRLGLYHFALLLPDRASLGRFVAHLAAIGERAGMSNHLVSEAIYLTDPDGLGIEVYADRPRSEWRIRGSAIEMATASLDVQDLLRVANGTSWSGAPAGTRVGHVHLYVSDLRLAEAYYHVGLGLDKVNLQFPGALFLSAGGYHHHLGTNTWAAHAPPAAPNDARLLEWTMVLPGSSDVEAAARSLSASGFEVGHEGGDAVSADPWGTRVRIMPRSSPR
jgi:catechol 2,3-dioxygenase